MLDPRFLEGRVALVTGGASGIGRACAVMLGKAGARVAIGSRTGAGVHRSADGEIVHLPGAEAMEEVRAEVERAGVTCVAHELDVTSQESVETLHRVVREKLGPVDILINAAGMTVEHPVKDHPLHLFQRVLDVNLTGVFRMTRECLPAMLDRGWGRIINIASTSASVGSPTSAAYAASKAGVVGFSRCVALEGAPRGVTCNTISPTWVETRFGVEWMKHLAGDMAMAENAAITHATATSPGGRPVKPDEVASLALYLCQEGARMMTMQDLVMSGGSLW